jgi:hypothetical protein
MDGTASQALGLPDARAEVTAAALAPAVSSAYHSPRDKILPLSKLDMIRLTILAVAASLLGVFVAPIALADKTGAAAAIVEPFDRQAALRDLATVAVQRTVEKLGHPDGLYLTPAFHIRLPSQLEGAAKTLATDYASSLSTALELSLNRSAEALIGPAADYVLKTLPTVTFADPERLTQGTPDAVTLALEKSIGPGLRKTMSGLVSASAARADAPGALRRMQARYEDITNKPFPEIDLNGYILASFTTAFFASLAEEEQAVRLRPSARSTDLLRRLFSKS